MRENSDVLALQRLLLISLIFLIPTKLGYHFDSSSHFVLGTGINYLIPTIQLTDVLVILLLFIFLLEIKFKGRNILPIATQRPTLWLLIFLLVLIPNINVYNGVAAWWQWFRIVEFSLLSIYIATEFPPRKNLDFLALSFSVPLIFQSVVALAQLLWQKSLVGYYFLGESVYSPYTPGVAKASLFGREIIRSYGTTPHPNVLGGFFVFGLIIVLLAALTTGARKLTWYFSVVSTVTFLGLLSTFSRSALLAFIIVGLLMLVMFLRQKVNSVYLKSLLIASIIFSIVALALFLNRPVLSSKSYTERYDLSALAVQLSKKNPVFGVGLNNFIPAVGGLKGEFTTPVILQPVHNIYLLILAESGIVGLVAFTTLLGSLFIRCIPKSFSQLSSGNLPFLLLTFVVIVGMLDHYLLSLQTGLLLLFFTIGFAMSKRN